ncbi:keratin, type I cytoskeletal 18 isoform X1 [Conger conger]|uniref:keratin, type I cytoskeletal 18 isoform X1 n=1 Tax=Conger conger TaxID=82655 RepID=UPI002A5A4D63|nr:keratin, type I cytoskeletal 18 isoform X1 [Conger conger]
MPFVKSAARNFSSLSASGAPGRLGSRHSSGSLLEGPGGYGSRISMSNFQGVSSAPRPFAQQNSADMIRADDKETMKGLNCRLDKYLSRVRTLEESNRQLEDKIKEELLKKGAEGGRDWSVYDEPLAKLRAQIRDMTMENATLLLQIDNARLAADDFKVKLEAELALRQGVEQDIAGLRKIIGDTNATRVQLENQIDATQEELAYLKKNHEEDLADIRSQINSANVSVEMNSPKGQDMNEIISKIRDQYEKAAQKNRDDTDAWYQSKFDKLTAEVSENTEALQEEKNELSSLRREKQSCEVELQALHNMNHTLEDTLADTQNRYAQQMGQDNQKLQLLEAQLGDLRSRAERQGAEYQALLNLKSKLEEEIATYHQLLEGGHQGSQGDRVEFSLDQALQAAPPPQTHKKVIIINQEVVDGEVVSEQETEVPTPNGEAEEEEEEEEEGTQSPPEQEVTSD